MKARLAGIAGLGIALFLIGMASVWADEAWLVPSLGSAVFTQALSPRQPSAQPYRIFTAQVLGAAAGMAAVLVAGAWDVPVFSTANHLVPARALAAGLAGILAAALMMAAKANSPAGGATAVIVALGLETVNWAGAGRMLAGITLVTVLGEGLRRIVLHLGKPATSNPASAKAA